MLSQVYCIVYTVLWIYIQLKNIVVKMSVDLTRFPTLLGLENTHVDVVCNSDSPLTYRDLGGGWW